MQREKKNDFFLSRTEVGKKILSSFVCVRARAYFSRFYWPELISFAIRVHWNIDVNDIGGNGRGIYDGDKIERPKTDASDRVQCVYLHFKLKKCFKSVTNVAPGRICSVIWCQFIFRTTMRKIHWAGTMIRFYCVSTLTSAWIFIDSMNNMYLLAAHSTHGTKRIIWKLHSRANTENNRFKDRRFNETTAQSK